MPDPHELDRELHRHAAALRGIARDLLRDPHVADDVAQDTLHKALAQRDLQPGPLGGWLYRTLTNFAHQWRRGERRRLQREARVPQPDPTPAPPEMLGRRETLQAVTNAVLGLDEPYQTAIFLRYFEDLPPRAIAQRTGANLATVKSRLQRGLVMLRARLDRQCGGDQKQWRLALLCTFGLPATTIAAGLTLGTGAWLLGTTTKSLFAAGLCCLGGLFFYAWSRDPAPLAAPAAADPTATAAAGQASSGTIPAAVEPRREDAVADLAVAPWLDHPYLLELDVLVVDPTGLPVQGRSLRLAPPNCSLNDVPTSTGPDGRVSLSWRSRLPDGEVVLADQRGILRRVALQHGKKATVTLGGRARGGDARHYTARTMTTDRLAVVSELPILGNLFTNGQGVGLSLHGGMHPHAVFGERAMPAQTAAEATAEGTRLSLAFSEAVVATERLGVRATLGAKKSASAAQARIAGTVFGEDGKPAAKVPVALLGSGPQPLLRVETDDSGQFAFEGLGAAEFTVRAGGSDAGLATSPAVTTTGTTPVSLNLRRGSCVRGRAVNAAGAPMAGAAVAWRAADGSWCDAATTGDDGSFVFANLPGAAGNVYLWEPTGSQPLRVATAANVLVDTGELLLQFDDQATSALQLDLAMPEGRGRVPVEVRVWQLDTGIGTALPTPEAGKPWRLDKLPAGWYRVELFAACAGWRDLGRHWLDGKADCDLGHVALPQAATVQLALEPRAPNAPPAGAGDEVELYELRNDVDVRLAGEVIPRNGTLSLPQGRFALAWRDQAGTIRFHQFTTRSGETLTLKPGP